MPRQLILKTEKHPDTYVAHIQGIPGTTVIGQGATAQQALTDLKSALRFHFETFAADLTQIHPDEDGIFIATCPALPGCITQGQTRVEAQQNLSEAIVLYLESLHHHNESLETC